MKCYKFIGDYKKLKSLGYSRTKFLEFDGFQNWSKVDIDKCCSIVIFNYVSVKVWKNFVGVTIVEPEQIEPYIKDLIENKMVEVGEL